ncbi:bacteriophage abortive infection AbiH family protein [Bacillus sp. SPARC3]|nr:bacteriophage abortive infection AbiH family protein [Bacillus sp. SPARC3]
MSNLFIIGNGFDLDHDLETSYDDFRSYLLLNYPEINMYDSIVPNEILMPDGGVEYDDKEVLSMLFFLINEAEQSEEKWSDIESSLGALDYSLVFDSFDDILDKDGDKDMWKMVYRNEDLAAQLVIPTTKIKNYFSEWIDSLKLNTVPPKKDFEKIIGEEDLFLTFNYTDTLEVLYNVDEDSICHIHGLQNEEIFFGHGNLKDRTDDHMKDHVGSQDSLSEIDVQLRKDTKRAIELSIDFFEELRVANISKIYSYGFSFNKVDAVYFKEICDRINTENITWYFNDFDEENIVNYSSYLRDCGFKGNFETFHIEK